MDRRVVVGGVVNNLHRINHPENRQLQKISSISEDATDCLHS